MLLIYILNLSLLVELFQFNISMQYDLCDNLPLVFVVFRTKRENETPTPLYTLAAKHTSSESK